MNQKALYAVCRHYFPNDASCEYLGMALGIVLFHYEAWVHGMVELSALHEQTRKPDVLEFADTCARMVEMKLGYGLHSLFPFSYEKLCQDSYAFSFIGDILEIFSSEKAGTAEEYAQIVDNLLVLSSSYEKRGHDSMTPDSIATLVTEIVQPTDTMTLYDPCCGYANCLKTAAVKYGCKIAGQELDPMTRAIAMMRLIVHGIDAREIWLGDVFSKPQNVCDGELIRYDVVLANPGFWAPSWPHGFIETNPESVGRMTPEMDPWHRFDDDVPSPSKFDYAFFHHAIQCVRSRGMIVAIFPMGTLFRTSSEARSRMRWLEAGLLDAVIKLPSRLYDVTPEPVCIVIMRPGFPKRDVFFIDASTCGTPDVSVKTRHIMKPQAIAKIAKAYRQRKDVPKFARNVSMAEIRGNDYNLNVSRYLSIGNDDMMLDPEAIEDEIFYIESRLEVIRSEMASLAKKLEGESSLGEDL